MRCLNNLAFTVDMINLGGTLNVTNQELSFAGHYTLVNINKYNETLVDPKIVQTMVKSTYNYASITQITTPGSGSRMATLAAFTDVIELVISFFSIDVYQPLRFHLAL